MWFLKNGTGWCQRYNLESEKKVSSRRSHAPVFRKQELKLASSSSQALKPSNAGLKPDGQGFKL